MSRIGKKIINIPENVTVEINNHQIKVKGPKGELNLDIHSRIDVKKVEKTITVSKTGNDKTSRSLHGLFRQLIANLITGVANGFEKRLELKGIGYRVQLAGEKLNLSLGYSHPIEFKAPKGIVFAVEKNIIVIKGIDKQLVGETAAKIRNLRPVEPYKGKGLRYVDEIVIKKVGKAAKAATAA
jgi:large subunit ribosomal protein L6